MGTTGYGSSRHAWILSAAEGVGDMDVVTCYLRYVIDPDKVADFEEYGRMWIPLVERFGGRHLGYFLPHEGANNVAVALFSFPSLAEYERYRAAADGDAAC